MAVISMRKMAANQAGVIHSVKGAGELGLRLREMGLVPGAEIQIMGRAPLNDPVHIKLYNNDLTLRNNEADHIMMEVAVPGEEPQGRQIVIALAGNPNAGKTSLFNKLTGLRAHVGNYPGVTVEQKWGEFTYKGRTIKLVDLPGTYSLNSYSLDEKVARDFVIDERPDLVLNVADATNLTRNLYLTVQFLELGVPLVLTLNMMDLAASKGLNIDADKLAEKLGVPVTALVATTGTGVDKLLDTVLARAEGAPAEWQPLDINYGHDTEEAIGQVEGLMRASDLPFDKMPLHWLAVKYLDGDPAVDQVITKEAQSLLPQMEPIKKRLTDHVRTTVDDELEGYMADRRYGFISGLLRGVVTQSKKGHSLELSNSIDKVLLNRLLSPFFFIAVIYALYQFTFWASAPLMGAFEWAFGELGDLVSARMADGPLKDLLQEGIIGGVGAVMGFAPLIAFMFVGISILEDSGYMARVAFIVDRVFRAFGLHGNSAVALIVGGGIAGGCAVPGVMAARTLRDPKERIATILVTPFMTCGAKLPVFLMLTAAFFSQGQAAVMVGLTVFGWCVALVSAKILRTFVLPGQPAPFVLELPPYRLPTLSGVVLHAWERTWGYIKKAGTVIVAATIVVWLMMNYPALPPDQEAGFTTRLGAAQEPAQREAVAAEMAAAKLKASLAGHIGVALEPVSSLAGFDWRTNIALVGGVAAKEVVLSTLGTAFAMGEEATGPGEDGEEALAAGLAKQIAADPAWSPIGAVAMMIFVLLYAPCFPTLAVIRKEIGGKWAAFALTVNTAWAFLLSVLVFQVGSRLL